LSFDYIFDGVPTEHVDDSFWFVLPVYKYPVDRNTSGNDQTSHSWNIYIHNMLGDNFFKIHSQSTGNPHSAVFLPSSKVLFKYKGQGQWSSESQGHLRTGSRSEICISLWNNANDNSNSSTLSFKQTKLHKLWL